MTIDYTDNDSRLQATIEAGHWLIDQAVERAVDEHSAAFQTWLDEKHPWRFDVLRSDEQACDQINRRYTQMMVDMAAMQNTGLGGLGSLGQQMSRNAFLAHMDDVAMRQGSGSIF